MRAPTHGLVLCGCGGGLAFAGKWDGLLGGIDLGWGLQVVIGTVPVHVPVVVVDEQVVSSAEEYPVGERSKLRPHTRNSPCAHKGAF